MTSQRHCACTLAHLILNPRCASQTRFYRDTLVLCRSICSTLICPSIRLQFLFWLLENLNAAYVLYLRNGLQSFSSHDSRQPDDGLDIVHFEWQALAVRNNGARIRSTWRKVRHETELCELRIDNGRYQRDGIVVVMQWRACGEQTAGPQAEGCWHARGWSSRRARNYFEFTV